MPITKITSNVLAANAAQDNLNAGSSITLSKTVTMNSSAIINGNFTVDGNVLFVDGVNNRVGIGTTTPNERLTVSGNISATANIQSSKLGLATTTLPSGVTLGVGPNIINDSNLPVQYSSSTAINYIGLNAQGSGYGGLVGFTQSEYGGGLILRTVQSGSGVSNISFITQSNNERMKIIGGTGNVGIGTTLPNERLTVSGNISASNIAYANGAKLASENFAVAMAIALG
jgi:hypothetical protein